MCWCRKIIVVAGYDRSLINFRGPLLRGMVQAGHTVLALAPAETPGIAARLANMGVRFVPIAMARAGLDPGADADYVGQLRALFERERPDLVLAYTIKPVVYGSLAAEWAGVPRFYALITGLGAAFYGRGFKGKLLRLIVTEMYRLALGRCTRVLVQNGEIADLFVRLKLVGWDKLAVVPGSGVDTEHFVYSEPTLGPPVFLFLGRLLRDKGLGEFIAAARLVKASGGTARFIIAGATDPNPASFSPADVDSWRREGVVEYAGFMEDVRPLLAQCSVYVLPSYHEGMPRSVLEAMAAGRPIITTDAIGCRETVLNARPADANGVRMGDNGLLVPPRTVEPLANAMIRMATDLALRSRMGRASRVIAEKRFDVRRINVLMLAQMGLTTPTENPLCLAPIL